MSTTCPVRWTRRAAYSRIVTLAGFLLAWALVASSCAHGKDFVWVDELPAAALGGSGGEGYRIGPGDVIAVRVYGQEGISVPRVRVRDDGRISLPLVQDVDVGGVTPDELGQRLQTKLKAYVVSPVVTVTLEEMSPLRVSVIGEVAKPGTYDLPRGSGVLPALAAAGGLTQFADRDEVFVLRSATEAGGAPLRIRFRFEALARGHPPAALFRLRAADVIVVE